METNCFKCIHGVNGYTQGQLFECCICLDLGKDAPQTYEEMIKIKECNHFEEGKLNEKI